MPKKQKKKVPDPELQYVGGCIKTARNANHLTQQAVADQAGIGLRHYQNIEGGFINPSFKVLSSIIHRLGMSADILFYPDIGRLEEEKSRLLTKFAACTAVYKPPRRKVGVTGRTRILYRLFLSALLL